ncbi:MAG: hypothetical protein QNJ67_07530 [Kiloniellales bacterium]|nr:hypothetical protein [Kiloniellales bacterium]
MKAPTRFAVPAVLLGGLFLSACAQDMGGITRVDYDAETGDIAYVSGKEAAALSVTFDRAPDGTVTAAVSAGDVTAFEGQAIQAERIASQTDAITRGIREALPEIVKAALCGAGIATAC